MRRINQKTATIPAGSSLSDAFQLSSSETLTALEIPDVWTSASLTFQAGLNTPKNVITNTGEYTISGVVAGSFISIDLSVFVGARYIKIRSGTSGVPVNQASVRTITVITTEI